MYFSKIEFGTPEYAATVALRDEVLRKPLNLQFAAEQLAEEWQDIHFVCFDRSDTILACMVFTPKEKDLVKMRQVAVLPELQGKGIGSRFVKASELFARWSGFKKIELNARNSAVPFYEKLGYKKVGAQFTEVGIPHFKMEKKLT